MKSLEKLIPYCVEVAKFDLIYEIRPISSDSNLIWFNFFRKSKWLDPTRTRTTRNLRWLEIKKPETRPSPNPNNPKIWDDPRSDNLKPDPTRTETTRNLRWPQTRPDPNPNDPKPEIRQSKTWPDPTQLVPHIYLITLKLYCINIKLLFVNSTCTWLPVYFDGDRVKHGFRGGPD
jgi:hypothetical protein